VTDSTTRWWWIRHAPVPDGGRIYGQSDLDCDCGDTEIFAILARELPQGAVWLTSNLVRTRQTAAAILGAGAVIAQERYGVSPESFGPLFSLAAAAFMLGATTARHMVRRVARKRFLLAGAAVDTCAGIGLAIAYGANLALAPFWALVCVYTVAFGLLMPTATAMALEPAGETAGLASSIIGTVQILIGALISHVVVSGLFGDSYASLCAVMAGSAAIAVTLILAAQRIRAPG